MPSCAFVSFVPWNALSFTALNLTRQPYLLHQYHSCPPAVSLLSMGAANSHRLQNGHLSKCGTPPIRVPHAAFARWLRLIGFRNPRCVLAINFPCEEDGHLRSEACMAACFASSDRLRAQWSEELCSCAKNYDVRSRRHRKRIGRHALRLAPSEHLAIRRRSEGLRTFFRQRLAVLVISVPSFQKFLSRFILWKFGFSQHITCLVTHYLTHWLTMLGFGSSLLRIQESTMSHICLCCIVDSLP